jgi:hypothetical protein
MDGTDNYHVKQSKPDSEKYCLFLSYAESRSININKETKRHEPKWRTIWWGGSEMYRQQG